MESIMLIEVKRDESNNQMKVDVWPKDVIKDNADDKEQALLSVAVAAICALSINHSLSEIVECVREGCERTLAE